jgi:hypothetical protein
LSQQGFPPIIVLQIQQLESFIPKRPHSPKNAANAAAFTLLLFATVLLIFVEMQGTRPFRGRAVATGRKPLIEPGLAKGAEDEKVGLVDTGRSGSRVASAGG